MEFELTTWFEDTTNLTGGPNFFNLGVFFTYFVFPITLLKVCLIFVIFSLFNQTHTILQQINVKNVHLVSSTGIQTHNLQIMSLSP